MRRKFLLMTFLIAIIGFCGTNLSAANTGVAKVGNTEYATIDEAIAAWTNNTTLTLLADVTLSDVIQLSSTEYHILDLGSYTMTAASKKDAIQIVNNGRSSAGYALDIKAAAANTGGITATGKAVVRTTGKSGVKDRPIIRFYNGVFNSSYIVYHSGSNGTNCPQFQFHGGVFNGTIYTNRTLNQFYGGIFNGSLMMSVDSSAYTLIAGGTFKQLSNLYMSVLNSSKFTIGSAKGVYDKEVYIDDNGKYVIDANEPAQGIEADVAKTPGTNDYLAYSKVATEGQLGYTDVYTALEKNTSATVTVYVEELDLKDSDFKGTIIVPEGKDITITNAPAGITVKRDKGEGNFEIIEPSEDGTITTIVPVEVATYDELVAALVNGGVIKLTADIIATGAVDGTDANIDLNGKTLTLNVGGNNFFGDSKVKNGSINITGCVASGDCIIGIGDYSHSATLTFDNVNVTGDGYSSAYAVLYVYNSSELNINGGSVVVSNDNASAGGVIKAHKAADGKINIVGTQEDPVELTFNNAKIGMLDGTVLMNYVDLDITDGANAINQSALTIKNSTLDITGADGRALTLSQGNVVVENSTLNFSNCSEGEIRFKKSLELTADNNSTINTCTTYADASATDAKINGVDVDASEGSMAVVTVVNGTTTVKEAPKGNDFTGYTSADAIWGEVWGNATESFVIKVLDANGNVMGTTSLNNVGGIIDGDVNVTWNIKLDAASNTDEYWTMAWTTAPTIDNMPAKVELWVDGVKVSGGPVVLNAPDNLSMIYAAVTDNTGKILAYHTNVQEAIKAAAVTGGARTTTAGTVEFLADVTVDKWIMFSETLSIGNGQIITIEKIEGLTIDGNDHTLTINSIESAGNGNRLFYDATNLNIKDLIINYKEGVVGGIGLTSGTINNVTFNGGQYGVLPGANGVTIDNCTFNGTTGYAVYYESEKENIVVNNNTFNTADGAYAITMRSNEQFTNNIITKGRVNLANSAASTVSGNDFGTERFKVYNAATATISDNIINNLVFNETDVPTESTFTDNTLSLEAQAAIDALPAIAGEGTEANPYLINDVDDLVWLQEKVDELAEDGSTQFAGKYFKLTNDIDLSGINWDPIGTMNGDHGSFKGVFDGGDHTISNLRVEQAGNGIGLFARTAGNAVIKNLKLNNVTVKSTDNSNYVGGLVGNAYASTKIENVHVSGNVYISGRGYIGGIAGHGYVVMDNVSVVATGDGHGNDKGLITSTFWCAGGVLGYAGEGATNIMNAHVENVVVTSAAGGLGAIVGMAEDNNGTQPISGSNLSAENVEIKTYTGAYGDAYANYALGYLYGGNPTSILTGDLSVEEVKIETSTGEAPEVNDAVAKIGNSIYFNLQAALNAAVENETITLLRDIKIAEGTVINNRTLTIDGNGKTIRQDENFDNTIAMFDINGGKVTIKNVTFDGVKKGAVVRTVGTEFAMDNVTAQNSVHTVGQGLFRLLGQNTITNSKFLNNNCSMVITLNYDGESNTPQLVDNCLFEGNECNSVAALYYVKGAGCTIKDSEFVENTVNCNNNGATVYLGFTENNVVTGNIFDSNSVIDASSSTRVAGAIFFGYEAEIENNVFVENTASNANNDVLGQICTSTYYDCTIDLSGNYWGGEAPEYGKDYTIQHTAPEHQGVFQLDNYYKTFTTDENGNVELGDKVNIDYVAQVGKFSYETLAEAFTAAQADETITLLGNSELSETIKVNKNVTLNLNGFTISGTDNATGSFALIEIQPGAELIINDSSDDKSGKITLIATNNRGWNAYSSVISNQRGKLTVNGGTLEHLGGTDMAYGIDNLTNGKGTYAETIINGGTVKSTYRAIRQFLNGTEAQNILTVNGGTIEGANKSIWMQDPSVNANTGTLAVRKEANLIGDVYLYVTPNSTSWPVEVSIAAEALAEGSEVMTVNVPAGYELELSDGIYGVTYAVATIDDNRYETLQAAITAVGTAETTINVIANTTENITIQEGANITIKFDEDITLNGYFAPFRGNLTINGGTINNTNSGASAIEINAGVLNLENVNISSARHAVRIDGAVTATINGGEYTLTATSGTRHAVNVSGGAEVTIKAGTFVGPKGTTMDSGSAVCVQASSKVTIEGGDFSGGKNHTLSADGNLIVTGGTFDQDPSAYLAQGYITKYNETTSRYEVFKGVAKIENVYFASIQDAIDAAQNNDVIVVLENIDLSTNQFVTLDNSYNTYFKVEGKTVTIDLNGKTISGEYAIASPWLVGVFSTENNGHLTLEDNVGTAKVDITGENGEVYALIANYESGCSITINGGTYILDDVYYGNGSAPGALVWSSPSANDVEGIRVNGGNFHLGNVATGSNASPWIFNVNGNNNRHIKVFGGTYNYNVFNQYWIFEVQTTKEYAIKYDGDEAGTWTVVPAVAWVNNQKQSGGNWYTYELGYTTLAEAIAAAEDCNRPDFAETVTLLQDITLENTITVNAGKDVILDLNEFTVSQKQEFSGSYSMIDNKGKLTIGGNGTIKLEDLSQGGGATWGTYIVNNNGELIVNNATLEHLGTAGDNFSTCIPIQNYQGKVTVNEGAYISSPEFRSLRDFTAGGEIIINGGEFNGQIWMQGLGNGSSSLTIKGGEFGPTANDGSSVFITNGTNVVNVSIEGGLFNTKIGATDSTKEGVAGCITGGVFTTAAKENTNENLLNENFAFAENADGTWTVMPAQEQSLVAGWNWYSSYLDIELEDLTNAIGDNGVQIKNQEGIFKQYNDNLGTWSGSLSVIDLSDMYMVNVKADQTLKVAAPLAVTEEYTITINPGWNWIGYPSNVNVDINTVLTLLTPEKNDLIKTQHKGYAQFNYNKWRGALKTMLPGEGYMYYSNATTTKTFKYTVEATKGTVEANVTAENNYWTPDATKYPFNMTMTAVVDGLTDANYEVAAFVNGELRGSARPIYVEPMDAYVLFLTIHGEDVEEMSFRLYDIDNDTEYDLSDRINYSNDAHLGSVNEPYVFSRGTTGIGEASMSEVNIYPNPTTTGTEINLQATCDKVEVFNALGVKVAEYQNVDTIDALETAGIYVIRITNDGNVQNCRLVVK